VATRRFRSLAPVDLAATLSGTSAFAHDPSFAFDRDGVWLATRTTDGPATIRFSTDGDELIAEAWGPGADNALERAPAICGAEDDPSGFAPTNRFVRDLLRRHGGVRVTRSEAIVESLLRTVVAQKVTGKEAKRGYVRMSQALGGPAPGPRPLLLPPDPERVAALGYGGFHPWGIERRRAETLIRVASRARRLEEAASMPLDAARERIAAIQGVGQWTLGKVGLVALGDPDSVPVGDYHLPNSVSWGLAGEARADDERMLELLDEFRPHRGRVVLLLKAGRVVAPKFGPRMPLRSFEHS
jgi:3-methyladenine DNA glycosylase/8-oxoguanine DNA glycosylase